MVECFLKFGETNKKLILPAVASVLYIIMDIIEYTTKMEELHIIFDLYTRGISYTLIILVPLVQKCCDRKNKNNTSNENKIKPQCTKKSILHFFFLYVAYLFYFGAFIGLTFLKGRYPAETEDYEMSHYHGLCTEEAIEIIFILIVSKILLKTRLYVHHYIGLLIFIIFSLGIDILVGMNIFKPGALFFFIYCIYLLFDSIYITYEKYMMDKLYYSPFIIVFAIGLLFLVTPTICAILIFIKGNMVKVGAKYKLQKFSDYFQENDYKDVIIHIVYLTSFRYVINILKILTIYYFTQNHIYTTYVFIKLVDYLIRKKHWIRFLSIILFVFQFLGLLIYLEIIELNFLKLNKNTKNNIKKRELDEDILLLSDEDSRKSDVEEDGIIKNKVEISPGYIIESEMATINRNSFDNIDNNY
jgi:hypothetical protein